MAVQNPLTLGALLGQAAQASRPLNPNQIDYPWLQQRAQQQTSPYQDFASVLTAAIDAVRKRQAILQALEDEGLINEVRTWINSNLNRPKDLSALISTGPGTRVCPVARSSHAGGVIDPLLPQGPYSPAMPLGAPAVNGVAGPPQASNAGLVGRVNWDMLVQTTTPHTTGAFGNQPQDLNRVASYFEITLANLVCNNQTLTGGRLVYDPFNRQYFVSDHYAAEYEVMNVAPYQNAPEYQTLRNTIVTFRNLPNRPRPLQQTDWWNVIDKIYEKMVTGEY